MSEGDKPAPREPIRFPVSHTTPPRTAGGFKDLGSSALALSLKARPGSLNGHWCRHCRGIWWGLPLEAQCPVCGRRG